MNWLPLVINLLLAIHILVSLLIVLLVLMQRPKNEGLGAAFGGGMTENLFGAQTTNVLQTITRWLGGIFFVLTLLLSFLYVRQTAQKSTLQERLGTSAAPAALPAPATPAPADANAAPDAAASDPVQPTDSAAPAAPTTDGATPTTPPAGDTPAAPAPTAPAGQAPAPAQ
ncbi:MAG TPA: preprotein translocase subunit SecG [Chthoniobacteraceae bacterium]|jgi:preprotein translocase subunit SecG|nr:preprotein translocase subunit SecG [Chthoniobacteraceae bacterium]